MTEDPDGPQAGEGNETLYGTSPGSESTAPDPITGNEEPPEDENASIYNEKPEPDASEG